MRTLHSFPAPRLRTWSESFQDLFSRCLRRRSTRPRSNAVFLREESVEKHLNEHYIQPNASPKTPRSQRGTPPQRNARRA